MIIKVTENCLTQDENEKEFYALRVYEYETNKNTFKEAVIDLETNWNSDNVLSSEDEFEGDCLDSSVIKVEIIEQ